MNNYMGCSCGGNDGYIPYRGQPAPAGAWLRAETGGDAAEQAVQAELEACVDGFRRIGVNAQIKETDKTGEQPGRVQPVPPVRALGLDIALEVRFRLPLGLMRP